MIKTVRIKKFKSHLDTYLKFTNGVNALIGIIGSGKTSVLQAIMFALFGTLPEIKSRRISINDLIMNRPNKMEKAEIEVEIEVEGKIYNIKRIIERKRGSYAEIKGGITDVGSENVSRHVERILGINFELFSKSIYAEQNDIDYFLKISKGKRSEHLDRIIGIDRYKKIREICVNVRNKVKNMIEEKIKVMKSIDIDIFKKEYNKLKVEIRWIEEKVPEMQNMIEKIKNEIISTEKKIEDFNIIEKEIRIIKEDITRKKAMLEEMIKRSERIEKEIEDFNENVYNNLRKNVYEMRKVLEKKETNRAEIERKLYEMNGNLINMKNRKKEIENVLRKIEEMEKEITKINNEFPDGLENYYKLQLTKFENIRKELGKIEGSIEIENRLLEEVNSVRDKCPLCESTINENRRKKIINLHKNKIDEMKRKKEKLKCEIEEMKKEIRDCDSLLKKYTEIKITIENYKRRVEEYKKLNSSIKVIENEIAIMQEKSNKVKIEIENLKSSIEEKDNILKEMEIKRNLLNEFNRLSKDIELVRKESRNLTIRLNEKEKLMKSIDIDTLRKKEKELIAKRQEILSNIKNLADLLKEKKKRFEMLQKEIDRYEIYKKDIDILESISQFLGKTIKVIEKTQVDVRSYIVDKINVLMNTIWTSLYPYGNFQSIIMDAKSDYSLKLLSNNGWVNVDSISGGERSLATIVLRIAFSLAFASNLRWIILDEPTHNLDTNSIRRFSDFLSTTINELVEQIFVITHERELVENVKGIVYEFYRNKENDEPTKVRMV